jgi:hypothetical protein
VHSVSFGSFTLFLLTFGGDAVAFAAAAPTTPCMLRALLRSAAPAPLPLWRLAPLARAPHQAAHPLSPAWPAVLFSSLPAMPASPSTRQRLPRAASPARAPPLAAPAVRRKSSAVAPPGSPAPPAGAPPPPPPPPSGSGNGALSVLLAPWRWLMANKAALVALGKEYGWLAAATYFTVCVALQH